MAPRSIIIDCDPGHDDALAILLALGSPDELDVLALTAVAGNVPLTLTEKNARKVVRARRHGAICRCTPAASARWCASWSPPSTSTAQPASTAPDLPAPQMPLAEAHAVDAIVDLLRTHPAGTITLCPTRAAHQHRPGVAQGARHRARIGEIVLMGGAIGEGNITPAAEFNIYVDPHAAKVVFEAGVPLVMHGLDVTHQALVTPRSSGGDPAIGTPFSGTVVGLLEFYNVYDQTRRGRVGAPLHDPCVIAYLLAARSCSAAARATWRSRPRASTRWAAPWSTGRGARRRPPNATVIHEIDADGFFALLTERLARLPLAPAKNREPRPRR